MGSISSKNVPRSGPMIYNEEELRIVLVGKTGAGKSATGNTILGKNVFESRLSPKSLTVQCAKAYGVVEGQKVAVIDTPGLFDTRMTEAESIEEVAKSVSYASPGPHVFLIVIRLDRFTQEEKQTVQKIQEVIGADADRYCMVLFTHGDLLRGQSIKDFLKDSEELQELVARCNNQYHVFNNMKKDRSQVRELLHKIRTIREKNRGCHYTTNTFQAAERKIQEETRRIQKEMEEKHKREMRAVQGELERMKELMVKEKMEVLDAVQQQSRQQAEISYMVIRVVGGHFTPVEAWRQGLAGPERLALVWPGGQN